MVAMEQEREKYPEIVLTTEEVEREQLVKRIGNKFQELMDKQSNACALKGGTAMRLSLGLPRPSTDLDFEGQHRVRMRRTVRQATEAAAPGRRHRVGRDWLWRGTVQVKATNPTTGNPVRTTIDYRRAGSMRFDPTTNRYQPMQARRRDES